MSQGDDQTPFSDPPPYGLPESYPGPPPYAAEQGFAAPAPYYDAAYGAPPPYAAPMEYLPGPAPYGAELEQLSWPAPYHVQPAQAPMPAPYGALPLMSVAGPMPYGAAPMPYAPMPYGAEPLAAAPAPYRAAASRPINRGWSMWRFNGTDWQMIEDRSVHGASPSAPSPSRGRFVGQIVRTPSVVVRPSTPVSSTGVLESAYAMSEVVRRAGEVPGYGSDDEMRWIAGTAAALPAGSIWVEVGTFCGRSFLAAGLSLPSGSTLMTIDVYLGQAMRRGQSILETYRELSQERQDLNLVLTRADSVSAAKLVPDHSCAVVYIDGDHSGPSVHRDVQCWAPKLVRGGILCGHDYGRPVYPGVTQVVDGLPGSFVAVDSIWAWYP